MGSKRKGKEQALKKQRGGNSEGHDTAAEEVRIVKPDWNRSNRLSKLAVEWQVDLYMEKISEITRAR
ncbi:hypothetical protein L1987_32680 [Smallanthus sonchifolius]|uniref:Uncharacterized protein n=1 Tax=Smallanthus sonchifolius TaxID=185202 RepID=A0ACB9HN97_9ASTR|nr:hypothetical protein L1987_32680 [Smallanthus sonchifolius]